MAGTLDAVDSGAPGSGGPRRTTVRPHSEGPEQGRTVPAVGPGRPGSGPLPRCMLGTDRTAEAPADDRIPCLPGGRIPRTRLPQAQCVRSGVRVDRASGRPSRPDAASPNVDPVTRRRHPGPPMSSPRRQRHAFDAVAPDTPRPDGPTGPVRACRRGTVGPVGMDHRPPRRPLPPAHADGDRSGGRTRARPCRPPSRPSPSLLPALGAAHDPVRSSSGRPTRLP